MAPPGIKDVAAQAGVSVGTVSNVLNRPDLVSEPTRSRVQAAIAELGFVRNDSARQLRAGRSRTVAYVVLDAGNPFFTDVARGVEDCARQAGACRLSCATATRTPSGRTQYLDMLRRATGAGRADHPGRPRDRPAARACRGMGIPVVLVDRAAQTRRLVHVAVDDVARRRPGGHPPASSSATTGSRFVGGPSRSSQVADRHVGARPGRRRAPGCRADTVTVIQTTA